MPSSVSMTGWLLWMSRHMTASRASAWCIWVSLSLRGSWKEMQMTIRSFSRSLVLNLGSTPYFQPRIGWSVCVCVCTFSKRVISKCQQNIQSCDLRHFRKLLWRVLWTGTALVLTYGENVAWTRAGLNPFISSPHLSLCQIQGPRDFTLENWPGRKWKRSRSRKGF